MKNEYINYIATNLRHYRNKLDLTQEQMANKLGINRTHYSNYENDLREPNFEMISRIYDFLVLHFPIENPSDLIFKDLRFNDELEPIENEDTIQIPVLGVIPAGQPIEAIENIIGYEEIPKSWTRGNKKYFGLKLKGDSMAPKYLEGDIIIFLQAKSCENGQECAVTVNGYDATFKKVLQTDLGLTLQPLNSNYELKTYSNEDIDKLPITIIGVAKELRRKL